MILPTVHAPWSGPYDIRTTFHEPFVLFGFLAGITSLEEGNIFAGEFLAPQMYFFRLEPVPHPCRRLVPVRVRDAPRRL